MSKYFKISRGKAVISDVARTPVVFNTILASNNKKQEYKHERSH